VRGSLRDLPLTDLVQIIASNAKTGKLLVTALRGDGLLVFRAGKIVYGATTSHREGFGSFLVLHGLVTEDQLRQALERQANSRVEQRLGSVLVEMGILSEEQLREVLRSQVYEVMGELLRWQDGVVEFEEFDLAEHGEVSVDAREFLLREGVGASGVMLGLVDNESERELSPNQELLASLGWVIHPHPPDPDVTARLPSVTLDSIRKELRTPVLPGEGALGVLRAASEIFSRGVLLMRAADGFRGLGQFGVWPSVETERVRSLRISHQSSSILTDVARTGRPFRGAPDPRPHNLLFFRFLESDPPSEAVVLPALADGETRLLFYGDNSPDGRPIGPTDVLEDRLWGMANGLEANSQDSSG
jgi:uncharacterized protein DUF4388